MKRAFGFWAGVLALLLGLGCQESRKAVLIGGVFRDPGYTQPAESVFVYVDMPEDLPSPDYWTYTDSTGYFTLFIDLGFTGTSMHYSTTARVVYTYTLDGLYRTFTFQEVPLTAGKTTRLPKVHLGMFF